MSLFEKFKMNEGFSFHLIDESLKFNEERIYHNEGI